MEKQEFLEKLRMALNGRLASDVVSDTVSYYEDYINTEVRMGREEEEVMNSLGDPRLIARTIVETKGRQSASDVYSEQESEDREIKRRYPPVSVLVWLALIFLAAVLIMVRMFQMIRVLWPFLIVIVVAVFFVRMFRDWFF
ncbi:MAG: DUF1700 domain-containing protein [bacterium]|nr:DUF1700 domain-containing protein [bacterium]